MIRNILTALFISLSLATVAQTLPAGVKLVETVTAKGNELVIPYNRYVFDNGLSLIVHEDHSDPIVHLDITYHVGSARELPSRSGFAHFFEHMMFQGSEHVGDEQHFKIITEAGGTMNGTTNSDRTNYFETVPSNQLETVLWLEADRMGFLLDSVTQRKFEVQRATVKNERGQNYDNRPYGLVGEKIYQALYPSNHPYHWPTIGYLEDLDRVDVSALKEFFMRWYGPNNATVTVAGDVDTKLVVELVKKYFGGIPRGPEVIADKRPPVKLPGDRYISYADKIRFPLLQFSFPTVGNYHPDEASLDVLADVLGGTKNSLFYQNFDKAQLAVQSSVYHPCRELAGEFTMVVLPYPGKTLIEMEARIRETLVEFEKRGVTADEVKRFQAKMESNMIKGLETVQGKASQLAQYNLITGNANMIQKDLDRYMKVTPDDVMRVFRLYIKDKPAVILSAYPMDKPELVAKADNFKYKRELPAKEDLSEYAGLTPNKVKDNFNRGIRPPVGPSPNIKVPAFWKQALDNGMEMIGAKSNELPKINLRLSIQAGHRFEDANKAGLAVLTASLMNEGTDKLTAEELEAELDNIGSSIDVLAVDEEIMINVSALSKNIDRTLQLMEGMLLRPRFDAEDFNRKKDEQLESIRNQVNQAPVLANNAFRELVYGKGHIMALPSIGNETTMAAITHKDVLDFHATWVVPNISKLVIVGDIDQPTALKKLEFLKAWAKKPVTYPKEPALPPDEPSTIYILDKAGAPQTEIRMGYMDIPFDATGEFFRTKLANFNLGGNFNSRINLNLREEKGWTYGASSRFSGSKYPGTFSASAGVKASATDSAIVEFVKEIQKMATSGITASELDYLRKALGQEDALKYEAGVQKAGFLNQILQYNLPADFTDQQQRILQEVTAEELGKLAAKHLRPEKMRIVVVGDKATIYPGLSKLNFPIKVLSMDKPTAK